VRVWPPDRVKIRRYKNLLLSLVRAESILDFIFRFRFRLIFDGIILVCIISVLRWGWVSPDIPNTDCKLSQNAAWISVDWTSQPVDEIAVAQLAENASARQIRYLFPFTTYVKSDGSFSPSFAHAAEFVSQFRRFNQETYLLAWVGVPLNWVNLADENTREEIATFISRLVREAGFDGVHLNVETVLAGNPNYLHFLDDVEAALGPEYIISIASSPWIPTAVNKLQFVNGLRWHDEYYQAVAERVDQIATMTYDSFTPHPVFYRLWMREQVKGISKSLKDSDVDLLIGVSISREHSTSHHPDIENMQSGLAGICAGFDTAQAKHIVQGVAIYAAWEAEATDWQLWDEWQGP
jgi:hypothetical protein